jgi:hypothetical protein
MAENANMRELISTARARSLRFDAAAQKPMSLDETVRDCVELGRYCDQRVAHGLAVG